MYTSQKAIRAAFWESMPVNHGYKTSKRQNAQPCDVRTAFCDFVDSLARAGDISDKLAQRVTL